MNLDDTIVAIATPLGAGGLGVVRLSGSASLRLAQGLFRGATPLDQAPSHTLHHGLLRYGEEILDEAVAGIFRAPRSYTGEDVVEFSCHGGTHILHRVLESCLREGARLADPGEFTRRAYLNGKMDLAQSEAVADLIAAHTDAQRRLALETLRGGLSHRLRPTREKCLGLLAHLEANLDFVEDEVPGLSRKDLGTSLESLETEMAALMGPPGQGRLWREGIRVAIVGRPNTGKSSLFNALLDRNRAIVADAPGTTRDTLEESLVWNGLPVTLVDTAGLRDTDDAVEREGAERARQSLEGADLALLVVEAGSDPRPEDRTAAREAGARPTVLVLNKSDLAAPATAPQREIRWKTELGLFKSPAVHVSARTGEGLQGLRREALGLAGNGEEPKEPGMVLNARQEQRLREVLEALTRARAACGDAPEETLAMELRLALTGLDAVTGQGAPEEVLDAIFSRFCVGK
ncbi:MAG: tRNA uridine-5-carboxymethylaminomethyl(34) synthesis GTPase MnmE [Elusimicrobia bacterium]|nr:tRNA uridine-5-carboxymethylaminomethyl(34) synthesis GTPase MnmE [Elusimicrobiota bacterium]